MEKLGLDFGDVIVDSLSYDNIRFNKSSDYIKKSYVPQALESIIKLQQRFGKSIYIVSRVDPGMDKHVLAWLEHMRFFEKTDIKPKQVFFCLKREEKNAICERLGITHFVDDRLEVLGRLEAVPNKYLFYYRPKPDEDAQYMGHKKDVTVVSSWRELLKELLEK